MKTLLVYPEFPDTYWSFRHALSFEGKRSAFPPLGLLTDAVTLARVVLALGIRDSARRSFWRYLRSAWFSHRTKFAEAVRLAALGYHFRQLTRMHALMPGANAAASKSK